MEKTKVINMLETIFEEQLKLNKYTFSKNDVGNFDYIPKNEKLQQAWIQNYALALQQELAELIDCTNWKWWRSKVDLFDEQNLCVELIDILHFWVSMCQIMGLSAEDVYQMYMHKNKINFNRQDLDYITKDKNDCKEIKPKNKKGGI